MAALRVLGEEIVVGEGEARVAQSILRIKKSGICPVIVLGGLAPVKFGFILVGYTFFGTHLCVIS